MKKNRFRLGVVASFLALLLFVSACAAGGPGGDAEAGEDTGKVLILGAFRGQEETAFNNVIAVFEEQNPDIDVIYTGTAEFETLITVTENRQQLTRRVPVGHIPR